MFWSEDDINTRFFESVSDQTAYFEELTRGKFSDLVNFNMGNNVETAVTYRDTSERPVSELIACNYAVVQEVDDEGSFLKNRYFFAYPSQDSGRQMRVTLSLDDIQTNYFTHKSQITPCLIRRANLNRWVDNGDNSVSFNGAVDSPLFFTEPLTNVGKRMTKRTKLSLDPATNDGNVINQWLADNVLGWEYVYLTNNEYNIYTTDAPTDTLVSKQSKLGYMKTYPFDNETIAIEFLSEPKLKGNAIYGSLVCLCYPIYKKDIDTGNSNCIKLINGSPTTYRTLISSIGMEQFYSHNNNKSNVYARKFSLIPPFNRESYPPAVVRVNSTDNTLEIVSSFGSTNLGQQKLPVSFNLFGIQTGDYENKHQGVFQVDVQIANKVLSNEYTIDKKLTFLKSEIVGADKDPKFNPKLLSQQFYEINIVQGGQKFGYDVQKLNKNKFKIAYTEGLTPDLTKGYARIYDTSGIYIKQCEENLTGLVYSNDNSLMVDNDKLSEMLANNKNFFMQQALQVGKAVGESVSAVKSARFDKPVETIFDIADKVMSLDNMRNAPNQVQNANGNVYFNALITSFALFIEEYDLLDIEKQSINDLMCQFGFAYNKIDNISNFDNIRHYYNYIEADVENISASISNLEKQRLKQKLKSVRFWNVDTIDYSKENYEKFLEETEEIEEIEENGGE